MHVAEQKWRANRDKVSFAKSFPGLLGSLSDAVGKRIEEVMLVEGTPVLEITLFSDHTFFVRTDAAAPAPAEILRSLVALRSRLESSCGDAYQELDRLAEEDRELTRQARLQNILGAIRGNIGLMPELFEEIPRLLSGLQIDSEPPPDRSSVDPGV